MIVKRLAVGLICLTVCFMSSGKVTLEECLELSKENYPLVSRYALLDETHRINLSDINKGWLPQIEFDGQGIVQNVVPSLPAQLKDILAHTGTDMRGLGNLQYKAGIEASQVIWDGGASKSGREIEQADFAARRAALDVRMYAVCGQVEELFFGILLTGEQIKQVEETQALLESVIIRLKAMERNGTAIQSDVEMAEAELISVRRSVTQVKCAESDLRRLLSIYTGRDMVGEELEIPSDEMPENFSLIRRPELKMYDAQRQAIEAKRGEIRTSLMPRIGAFAQAYFGYPGFDYFKGMIDRDISFNALAGVRVSWNIGSFYTKRNRELRVVAGTSDIEIEREMFLFQMHLETQSMLSDIEEMKEIMKDDGRLVELRENVRKSAESQLANGVIDATELLRRITDENQARLSSAYHQIELIRRIYRLRHTLNR